MVSSRFLSIAVVACLGILVSSYSLSQSSSAAWVSLDGSKAGTPAEVVVDKAASNASSSTFTLVLHGYWSEKKDGPGGPYTKYLFPVSVRFSEGARRDCRR